MIDPSLLRACRLLFGEEAIIGKEFLNYLQASGLKSAFRRRALETHPDSQHSLAGGSNENFHAIQQAFAVLTNYLNQRDHITNISASHPRGARDNSGIHPALRNIGPIILESTHRSSSSKASIDRFYQGGLPQRPLLFGHFLYYSGLTTWRTITSILVQQQRGRPRFGELGTHLGLLYPEDINRILGAKTSKRHFGEVAVSLGILTMQQMETLLKQQQRQQKKFGVILVENNLITLNELSLLLTIFRHHNRYY